MTSALRILEVTHYMPPHVGGIEMVAESLVRGLGGRGHDVRWLSSAVSAPAGREGDRIRVPAWNVLEEKGGVPYPLWAPSGLVELDRAVSSVDVVHVHDCLYMGSAAAAASAKRHGKPLLVTQHIAMVPYGKTLDRVQRLAYETLGRTVLSMADALVACAPHVPEFFREVGIRKPFTLIRNGIDDGRFALVDSEQRTKLRAELGIAADARVLLFSGRLVAKKGVHHVAALQRRLEAEGKNVVLVVAGDGALAHLLADLPRTVRLGSVPASRMPQTYSIADVLVLPSHGEGLPLGVQEALFSGVRVVVSEDPAFRDALTGMTGVRFAADDDALYTNVVESFEDGPARESVRAGAVALWGLEGFLDAYEAELSRLRARSSRG